jgi:hypothetical protein
MTLICKRNQDSSFRDRSSLSLITRRECYLPIKTRIGKSSCSCRCSKKFILRLLLTKKSSNTSCLISSKSNSARSTTNTTTNTADTSTHIKIGEEGIVLITRQICVIMRRLRGVLTWRTAKWLTTEWRDCTITKSIKLSSALSSLNN